MASYSSSSSTSGVTGRSSGPSVASSGNAICIYIVEKIEKRVMRNGNIYYVGTVLCEGHENIKTLKVSSNVQLCEGVITKLTNLKCGDFAILSNTMSGNDVVQATERSKVSHEVGL